MIPALTIGMSLAPALAAGAEAAVGEQTWAGAHSDSIAGYLARRTLVGLGSSAIRRTPAGVFAFEYDQGLVRETISAETLDQNPDPAEREAAHSSSHATRLQWASEMATAHLELYSEATRRVYERTSREITGLNNEARGIWADMVADWQGLDQANIHGRNVAIGPRAVERYGHLMQLVHRTEMAESAWQQTAYRDLMSQLEESATPPSDRQQKRFTEAYGEYEQRAQAYHRYNEFVLSGARETDDGTRVNEHTRKKMEQKTFLALWRLHETVREIYEQQNHRGAEVLGAPLTFIHKTQAYNIARGPNKMVGLEPFLEITWNFRHLVKQAKKGELGYEELDHLAATAWGLNVLTRYYRNFRIAAPDGFPVFSHHRAEELSLIQGGLQAFPDGAAPAGGKIAHYPHTGSIDYAAIVGSAYLMGLEPPAVLAEKAFRFLPAMSGFLGMRGVFLDRSKGMDPVYENMAARVEEGMMVAVFGTGTRAIDFPLVSPFSDLDHPGALHLPGEFIPSRAMTGMHIKLAEQTGAPLYVFATNTHRGGIAEPSIPRDAKGFFGHEVMFHYTRLQEEDGFAALAGVLSADSLIRPDDYPEEGEWGVRQMNTALVREMEMLTGYRMDAGPMPA